MHTELQNELEQVRFKRAIWRLRPSGFCAKQHKTPRGMLPSEQ